MKMARVQLSCYPLWFSLTACFSNGGEISSRSKLSCSKHFCTVYVASTLQRASFMFCSVDRLSALPVASLCVFCECTNMLLFYCHATLTETSFGKLLPENLFLHLSDRPAQDCWQTLAESLSCLVR